MPGYLATKRLIRREIFKEKDLKTITRETGSFSISNSVFNIIMPLPSLGGSDDQRIGDEIDVRSFEIRMRISAPEDDDIVRITVVQWRPPIDDTYSINDLRNAIYTHGAASSFYWIDTFNSQTKMNYHILDDVYFNINENVAPRSVYYHKIFTAHKDYAPSIHFLGPDGSLGNWTVSGNMIFVFLGSNSTVIPHPAAEMTLKVNFTDG